MVSDSESLDSWRSYFRSSNCDIFSIIKQAITVAALDYPVEMRLRRDGIAEVLFSCHIGCDGERTTNSTTKNVVGKESVPLMGEGDKVGFQIRKFSNEEAEALNDEMEQEDLIVKETMRIKMILDNFQDQTEKNLFNSLKKLQLLDLSVDILTTTEVGKSVNAMKKHSNKEIQKLARMLLETWKKMVDEWMCKTAVFEEPTPNEANYKEEGVGLPSPPMDDIAFFATYNTNMELSNFFDGIDEDGNTEEYQNNSANTTMKQHISIIQEKKVEVLKKPAVIIKQCNKPSLEPKTLAKVPTSKVAEGKIQKSKPITMLDEDAKVAMTKKRLQERYQELEEAKKKRTVKVVEIQDLPKHIKNSKPGNPNYRPWKFGRP